jgi:uncharacterized protein
MKQEFQISSEEELIEVVGEAHPSTLQKVCEVLDDAMIEFIQQSPLVFISTTDDNGLIDISPKGDAPGFVQVDAKNNLLLPERPGNKMALGFKNILRNSNLGLIFVIPNTRETLRVKGLATLTRDPDLLQELSAQNKPAILCTHIEVKECFFHCGKAMIRSKAWQPDFWNDAGKSLMAKQLSKKFNEQESAMTEHLEESYRERLY